MSLAGWLSPLNIQQRHRDLSLCRADGVGSWLLENRKFLAWRDDRGSPKIFLCTPEDQETALTSLVIDHLCETLVPGRPSDNGHHVAILYFYGDYLEQDLQTPVNALGSLLQQLDDARPGILEKSLPEQGDDKSRTHLTSELAAELLSTALNAFDEVFICLDGLMLWDRLKYRDLSLSLYEALHKFNGRWRLFATGREYCIGHTLEECLGEKVVSVRAEGEAAEEAGDKAACIKYRIKKDNLPAEMNPNFEKELISYLGKKSGLLNIDLNLRLCLSEPTFFKRRRLLLNEINDSSSYIENTSRAAMTRLQQLPTAKQAMIILKAVHDRGTVPVNECRSILQKEGIAITCTSDAFGQNLTDICLGLVSVGQASGIVRFTSRSIWRCLQNHEGLAPVPAAGARTRKASRSPVRRRSYGASRYGTPIDDDYDRDLGYDDEDQDKGAYPDHHRGAPKRIRLDDDSVEGALLATIITESPNVRWHQIAGLGVAKEALQEATILPQRFPSLYSSGRRRPWGTILLYGPPGTGKTLLAKAVATETQRTFFCISSADLLSKYYGRTERLIKELFVLARRRKPSVIFIDEIDALGTSRSTEDHHWYTSSQTELFVQLDGVGSNNSDVLLMAATNVPWLLDSSLRRRFHRRIYTPLPDADARAQIFQQTLGSDAEAFTDYKMLGALSEGFSGSDISIATQEVLMQPIRAIQKATNFKKTPDGKFMPCAARDKDALEMTFHEVPDDKVTVAPLQVIDFVTALQAVRPSVDQSEIVKFDVWTKKFGLGD